MSTRLSDLPPVERSRVVCERLTRRIGEVAPRELGGWDPAWDYVAEPSDAFLDALNAWLHHDSDRTRQDLQEAADHLVRAWREAGRRYLAEGRPESREEVPA